MRLAPEAEHIREVIPNVIFAKHAARQKEEPRYTDEDWRLFQNLVASWRRERGATSSINRMVMCESYQHIIGLGEKALPMILKQIDIEGDDPDHWNWALTAITRVSIVPEEELGNMRAIAARWKQWARTRYGG
jgi:hypothetical protein